MICHSLSVPCSKDYCAVWILYQTSPIPCPYLVPVFIPVHVRVNVYTVQKIFISDMGVILSIPRPVQGGLEMEGAFRRRGNGRNQLKISPVFPLRVAYQLIQLCIKVIISLDTPFKNEIKYLCNAIELAGEACVLFRGACRR